MLSNLLCTSDCIFFFFSSRRRHTRFKCDWSSDVCSSDLPRLAQGLHLSSTGCCRHWRVLVWRSQSQGRSEERRVGEECRSRGSPYHLKKKKKNSGESMVLKKEITDNEVKVKVVRTCE